MKIIKKCSRIEIHKYCLLTLQEEIQDQPAGYNRSNLSRYINAYRLHQQIVLLIFCLSQFVHNAAAHREGRNTCGANHGVNLCFKEQVKELCK